MGFKDAVRLIKGCNFAANEEVCRGSVTRNVIKNMFILSVLFNNYCVLFPCKVVT
jgi:hypothetical protein